MENLSPETRHDGRYYAAQIDAGNSGSTTSIDWARSNAQRLALVGDITTFNFTGGVAGLRHLLEVVVDGTGGYTVAWPADVIWPKGYTPPVFLADEVIEIAFVFGHGGKYRANLAVYEE